MLWRIGGKKAFLEIYRILEKEYRFPQTGFYVESALREEYAVFLEEMVLDSDNKLNELAFETLCEIEDGFSVAGLEKNARISRSLCSGKCSLGVMSYQRCPGRENSSEDEK